MTRINAFIPVEELSREHLLAEHREIKRIPNMINSGKARIEDIPDTFRLGTGHVKFFYNKIRFLFKRYCEIYDMCMKRGYKVESYHDAFGLHNVTKETFKKVYNDWDPSLYEIKRVQSLIRQRIIDNNKQSKLKLKKQLKIKKHKKITLKNT
jgi:hypothetical protein